MKIAILANGFPSKGNPSYVFVQQLVFALVDMGIEISVIAPQSLTHALVRGEKVLKCNTTESTKKGNLFEVYRPYRISFGKGRKKLYKLVNKFNKQRINRLLTKINPTVLYGHFWYNANTLKDFAIKNNLPIFVACGEGDNALEELVDKLSGIDRKELSTAVKGVISVSSENKRKCIDYGLTTEEKIIVLPNCVDDTVFHPTEKDMSLRKELGIEEDDFVILFIGSFIKRKGPDRLIEAVKKLNDQRIKLIFIGRTMGGDEVDPVYDNIMFKGTVNHDNLPQYFNAADLFVLPTLKEGCCNAIVESLACGLPVVSANRAFNDDILNKNNSITVNPENIDEIAQAIYKFKNDKSFYSSIKQYAIEHSNQYSITTRAKRIIDFIKSKI